LFKQLKDSKAMKRNAKIKEMSDESERLDSTLRMSDEIMQIGAHSGRSLHAQHEKLKAANKRVKHIEKSLIPGLGKLMTMIGRSKLKNTLILALVIAFCLAVFIYGKGLVVMG